MIFGNHFLFKWSCVYDHIHNEYQASKRKYLRFLQDYASTLVKNYSETLKEETVKAFSTTTYEETIHSRWKIYNASNTGNYFFHFTKTLQDGIDVVKVKSYENIGNPYWLFDRCTCGNTWLDMKFMSKASGKNIKSENLCTLALQRVEDQNLNSVYSQAITKEEELKTRGREGIYNNTTPSSLLS
ncbi:RING-type domain-containing protein [Raphanus sativus]|nr:RING-type domain-containing protein [Raphanus sativus]